MINLEPLRISNIFFLSIINLFPNNPINMFLLVLLPFDQQISQHSSILLDWWVDSEVAVTMLGSTMFSECFLEQETKGRMGIENV